MFPDVLAFVGIGTNKSIALFMLLLLIPVLSVNPYSRFRLHLSRPAMTIIYAFVRTAGSKYFFDGDNFLVTLVLTQTPFETQPQVATPISIQLHQR